MKKCIKCKKVKSKKDFSECIGNKDGLNTWCKECHKKYTKEYSKFFEYSEYIKNYYKNNKKKFSDYFKTDKGKSVASNSHHKRRTQTQFTDIDSNWLNNLFNKTKKCPLCKCKLSDNGKQYPDGKQLDHITPLNIGGEHMKNNVRFICMKCNLERPKDGSDNLQIVI